MTTIAVIALAVLGLALVGVVLKRTARAATMAAVALLLVLVGYYVWPTPYRFYPATGQLAQVLGYRESRLTGLVDVLTPKGWIKTELTLDEASSPQGRAQATRVRAENGDVSAALRRELQLVRDSTERAKRATR